MDRSFRWLALLTFVGVLFSPSLAFSAPKDAAATKLADDAINNDYLATNFAEAEKKLRSGLKMCGTSACSAQTIARLHRDLGVVLVAGLNRAEDGRKEFAEAIKTDPNVALEKDLVTPEIDAAFQAAKGGGASTPPAKPGKPAAAGGDMTHTPPAEQAMLTPVPIYVELADGVNAVKVLVQYKAFGATEWKKLELRKTGNGYGGEIPCQDVGSATGDLSYYVQAIDSSGDIVSMSGTRNAPNKVAIKNQLEGEAPHLPGKPAPARCVDPGDCPPGFPCEKSKKKKVAGGLGWGDACQKDSQCTEGLACKNGQCEMGEKKDTAEEEEAVSCESNADCSEGETCNADKVCEGRAGATKKLWLSASIQPDMSFVSSQDNVCGSIGTYPPSNFKCLDQDGFDYEGIPEAGLVGDKRGNAVKGGSHISSVRALIGLDYLVSKNISVGGRLGYALGVMPGRTISAFHLEARATYWFGRNPFRRTTIRPYVALIGGLAEIDDKFTVAIRECTTAECTNTKQKQTPPAPPLCPTADNNCLPLSQDLTVWRKAGGTFAGLSGGVMIPLGPNHGVMAELKVQGLFPNTGFAVSPSVGYAFGL